MAGGPGAGSSAGLFDEAPRVMLPERADRDNSPFFALPSLAKMPAIGQHASGPAPAIFSRDARMNNYQLSGIAPWRILRGTP